MKRYLLLTIPLFLLGSGQVQKDSASVKERVVETPKQNTAVGDAIRKRNQAEREEAEAKMKWDSTFIAGE